jgi:hypothetical protein
MLNLAHFPLLSIGTRIQLASATSLTVCDVRQRCPCLSPFKVKEHAEGERNQVDALNYLKVQRHTGRKSNTFDRLLFELAGSYMNLKTAGW